VINIWSIHDARSEEHKAQLFSRRPTADTGFPSHYSSCTICGGQTLIGQVSLRVHLLPSVNIIIIIFLHGLGRWTCSSTDALPSFPGASTISSSSRFVVEVMFRKSGVVHSFEMVVPVLSVFGSHVLYSRDLQYFSYDFTSCFV